MKNTRDKLRLRFSIRAEFLPRAGSYLDRFRLAAEAGFQGIEIAAIANQDEVERVGEAAKEAGITIHSVNPAANWAHPLSSEDPQEVSIGVRAVLRALENAHSWGADTVLLIPGLVTSTVSPAQAYTRSQHVIRNEILPVAQELGIVVGVENCSFYGFLLTPMEYIHYIDEFESPWARAYIDVGNMILGYPEHWIRLAGSRIIKLHVKDFSLNKRLGTFSYPKIGNGANHWSAISDALADVGFSGWATYAVPQGVLKRGAGFPARLMRKKLAAWLPGVDRTVQKGQEGFARLPGVDSIRWKIQKAFTLPPLRDAALRCNHSLK